MKKTKCSHLQINRVYRKLFYKVIQSPCSDILYLTSIQPCASQGGEPHLIFSCEPQSLHSDLERNFTRTLRDQSNTAFIFYALAFQIWTCSPPFSVQNSLKAAPDFILWSTITWQILFLYCLNCYKKTSETRAIRWKLSLFSLPEEILLYNDQYIHTIHNRHMHVSGWSVDFSTRY